VASKAFLQLSRGLYEDHREINRLTLGDATTGQNTLQLALHIRRHIAQGYAELWFDAELLGQGSARVSGHAMTYCDGA
jgi:hypothetical protein